MSSPPHSSDSEDDSPPIPLEHQRAFGTGLRKPITFIRASTSASAAAATSTPDPPAPSRKSAAERYLEIIASSAPAATTATTTATNTAAAAAAIAATKPTESAIHNAAPMQTDADIEVCSICSLPLNLTSHSHPHESLLAHQVSLPHVYPPSALDRNTMGMRYLVSYGWDPDAREGLGKKGDGIRVPVRVVEKRDTLGIGVVRPVGKVEGVRRKVGAKEARGLAVRERRREERLRGWVFGRDEEVERVLKGG